MANVTSAWHAEDNLSIVIVRHPMSRLASVYYQKFVELKEHKAWKKVSGHPNNNSPLVRTTRIAEVGFHHVLFRLSTQS